MYLEPSHCPVCNNSLPEAVHRCTHCSSVIVLRPGGESPFPANANRNLVRSVVEQVRQSLLERPEDGRMRYRLGLCYYNLGLLDESIEQIQQAAALMPERTEVRYELAVLLHQKGKLQDALNHLDKAIAHDNTLTSAFVLRGLIHQARDSIEQAVADWQAALRLGDPTSRKHLQAFVREYRSLVPKYVQPSSVSDELAAYIRLLARPDPTEPRPLGATSMRILKAVWPAKARVMRSIYQARIAEYRRTLDDLTEQRKLMEEDVLGLSSLCIEAHRRRQQQVAAMQARAPVPTSAPAAQELTVEERRAILDRVIGRYSRQGYRVVSRTDTAAQLVRPKKFSFWWALFWFLFFGAGILVYVFYYMSKRDTVVYLEIDPRGRLVRR